MDIHLLPNSWLTLRVKLTVTQEMDIHIDNIYLGSGSKTVLNYLRNMNSNFGPYIIRRCNEIRQNANVEDWNHIPTDLNIADFLSRGILLENSDMLSSWFTGPNFIKQASSIYNFDSNENGRNTTETAAINQYQDLNVYISEVKSTVPNTSRRTIFWEYYSSWNKIKRHLAWIVKLKANWLERKRKKKERENFNFVTLNNQSLICVGSRVKHTDIFVNSNYQVIVNKDHPIAQLIIQNYHEQNLHVGREQALSSLRSKYWIHSCCGIIRSVIKSCVYCKRERINPLPSDIPEDRLCVDKKPFINTDVDYLSPYRIKLSKRTRSNQATAKTYVALFTCLITGAVHLEIAGDLSTDGFKLALRRFISREGKVNITRSDNGTNFVGAPK